MLQATTATQVAHNSFASNVRKDVALQLNELLSELRKVKKVTEKHEEQSEKKIVASEQAFAKARSKRIKMKGKLDKAATDTSGTAKAAAKAATAKYEYNSAVSAEDKAEVGTKKKSRC